MDQRNPGAGSAFRTVALGVGQAVGKRESVSAFFKQVELHRNPIADKGVNQKHRVLNRHALIQIGRAHV